MIKEDLTKFVFKLFQTKKEREEKKRKEEKGTYLNTFYEANTTLIPIPDKDHNKRKLQTYIPYEYRLKSPEQNMNFEPISATYKKIIHYDQIGLIPGIQDW